MYWSLYDAIALDEHIAFGNALKRAVAALDDVYPKTGYILRADRSKPPFELNEADRAALTLRSELDHAVQALVPRERDPRSLAPRVYYGPPLVKTTAHADPEGAFDAFAGWEDAE